MKYKKFLTCNIAFIAAFFGTSNSLAEEGVVRAKLSLGYANYSSPYGNTEISTSYLTQGLGLSYIFPSKVFVDLTTKISGKDASYNASKVYGGLVASDQAFSRTENTLTIGKPTDNGMQVNAGIFTSDTTFNLAQYGQFSQKVSGLTAGAGKGYLLEGGNAGSIGISGAFALLSAQNTDRFGVTTNSNLSYGASLAATYNYPLSKNISVLADAKFQSYFIKYPTFSGDEKILSYSISLAGQF